MDTNILSDIMSSKASMYRFHTGEVKKLIKARGGYEKVAVALRTTVRTIQRAINNESLNGRLQRDLVRYLRVSSGKIGYRALPPSDDSPTNRGANQTAA